MPTTFVLPHNGELIDLDAVKVFRAVSRKESDGFNQRMATAPGGDGVIRDSEWTVALEVQGERGITPRYTRDPNAAQNGPLTVGKLHRLLGSGMATRYDVIDGGTAAVHKDAKVVAIRPLAPREGSDKLAVVYIEGGSSNGLYVRDDVEGIKRELGHRASHLSKIGNEGYIDRTKLERVNGFDQEKDLKAGQQRFTTAVRLKGVYRPQFFMADSAAITGNNIINPRAALDQAAAQRPGGPVKPGDAKAAPQVA